MQIYSKSMKNATSLSFLGRFWFCLFYLIGLGAGFFYTEFWNSLIMQIYANLFKINEKCYFSISWAILILFGLSDRAWWGLQNFYTEFWNSLTMQIYANLFKINEKCHLSSIQISQQICTSGGDIYYASRNLLSTCFSVFSGFKLLCLNSIIQILFLQLWISVRTTTKKIMAQWIISLTVNQKVSVLNPQHLYRKDTSIRQAPVFRHLRALRKSPWKFIIWMNEV